MAPFPEREGGIVLSATIDRYAHAALRPRSDRQITIASVDLGHAVSYSVEDLTGLDGRLDLVRVAIRNLIPDDCTGFDLFLHTDAPPGSGLGSSSTLVVALVGVVNCFLGRSASPDEVARLAYAVERVELGISGGLQDQYAAAFGGFNLISCDGEGANVSPLALSTETVFDLQQRLLLCFMGNTRPSDRIIDDQTSRLLRGDSRTLNGLREQKNLAGLMHDALLAGQLDDFGELLGTAWHYKKQLSPRVTTPLIDEAYDEAVQAGALGGKVTGAGGGGHMLLYAPGRSRHRVAEALERIGVTVTGVGFSRGGLRAWSLSDDGE